MGLFVNKHNKTWECLLINDGSSDKSQEVAQQIIQQYSNFKLINLNKNYGQSAALYIGFKQVSGKYISMMDADLQNDPKDIPRLYDELLRRQVDVMNGHREIRQDSLIRKVSSRLANGFRNFVTGKTVRDVGCSIRVFKRECTEFLPCYKGMHRFLPSLFILQGYKIAEMPVNHRPRQLGTAKYGIGNRLWVGIADTFAMLWMQNRLAFPKVASEVFNERSSNKKILVGSLRGPK
jgi:dolichol-phosphate mannosyltransferase